MLCVGQTPLCHQAPGATNFTCVANCGPYALSLLQGAQRRAKAALQTWPWLLGGLPVLRGRAVAASAQASSLSLPSCLVLFWHGLAWLLAPGTGWWAGGWCCCDLAPSRLPNTRSRQPKEQRRSLQCNLWHLGENRADRWGSEQSVFGHHSHPGMHTKGTCQF